jgi:hypothetical protein
MKLSKLLLASFVALSCASHADLLEDVQKKGYLTVGTTGDYKPFSYFDGKDYSGYDIDVARHIAAQIGVEVRFVKTSWKGLVTDLVTHKYDIAMGGITRRISRQLSAEQTQGDVDVMVTETPEALYYQTINNKLQAVREENPFTKSQFGYLIPTGEQRLLNTVNFIMDEMELKGVDLELMKKNSLM